MTTNDPERVRKKLTHLIERFEDELMQDDLRSKVLALIPSFRTLKKLGVKLMGSEAPRAARDRILAYFLKYPKILIHGDEVMVISGIQEWGRRIRVLRVQFGWSIASGATIKHMLKENECLIDNIVPEEVKARHYILLSSDQDRDAAHRWNIANGIRKRKDLSIGNRILEYLRHNVGVPVTGEELSYIAKGASAWTRRVRELRTQQGWPVVTKANGRPDLPVGVYLLESDRQTPEHDRRIPDPVRGAVLRRDNYKCSNCDWCHGLWNRSDPRHLELHHLDEHVHGGQNIEDNLITLCTICHDDIHRT